MCYCELALAAVLMSEDQCVLLRAHFGRCSDLITFGTDIREDFISRTTSAGPYQNVKLRRFFDGAGGTWSCNEDGEAEPFQNMKLIFLMRS